MLAIQNAEVLNMKVIFIYFQIKKWLNKTVKNTSVSLEKIIFRLIKYRNGNIDIPNHITIVKLLH
jgi:hypothetical protein